MRLVHLFAAICLAARAVALRARPLRTAVAPSPPTRSTRRRTPSLCSMARCSFGAGASPASPTSARASPIPKGTRTSECRGVVVAGFQNSHVHFMEDVWNDAAHAPAERLQSRARSDAHALRLHHRLRHRFGPGEHHRPARTHRERRGARAAHPHRGLPLYPPDGIPFYIRDLPPELLAKMHQPRNAAEARERDVRANLADGADGTKLFLSTSPDRQVRAIHVARSRARRGRRNPRARQTRGCASHQSRRRARRALPAGVDVLVHTTLGETAPWDARSGRADGRSSTCRSSPRSSSGPTSCARKNVPAPVVDKLVGATLEELRAFNAAGGQILFGTDVGYMHEYDPTDEYVFMPKAGLSAPRRSSPRSPPRPPRAGRKATGGAASCRRPTRTSWCSSRSGRGRENFAKVRCVFRGGALIYRAP